MTDAKSESLIEDLTLTCSNCSYWEEVIHPKTKERTGKGWCFASPPTVIAIPQQSKVALGQAQINFQPQMFRVATEGSDRFCGHYSPDKEVAMVLEARMKAEEDGDQRH